MDEFSLIARYFAPLAPAGALGLKDDAALLNVASGHELVVTADAIAQGVHFTGEESPDLIARKLLRVNLSDLAAKGATPLGCLLTLALPEKINEAWIAQFAKGLEQDTQHFALPLMGGDTIRTKGTLTCSLTAMGTVEIGKALLRSSAKADDAIYVTGSLGDGALGLKAVKGELNFLGAAEQDFLKQRYLLPEPRLEIGRKLLGIAHACMDVSDGLLQDMGHICNASSVGAEIYRDALPLSAAARACVEKYPDWLEDIYTGGDDYELLFTVSLEKESYLENLPVTRIGKVTVTGKTELWDKPGGRQLPVTRTGYRHF